MSLKNFLRTFIIMSMTLVIGVSYASAGSVITGSATALFDNPLLVGDAAKVNFKPTNATTPADLTTAGLTGQAWSGGTGWMQFSGAHYSVGLSCDPATRIGTFSGYGWGEGSGWINFAPTHGGLTVNPSGQLDGAIWAQSTGWMLFDATTCPGGDGCVQFDFECPSTPSGGGSGGGGYVTASCSLFASDTSITSGETVDLSWALFGTDQITLNTAVYGPTDMVSVSPTQTTLYTASVTRNGITKNCSTTITVDNNPPTSTDAPTCKDPEANNYDPSGDIHKQSLCTYTFNTCFQGIDEDCAPVLNTTPTVETPLTIQQNTEIFDPATQCVYFQGYWKKGSEGHEVAKIQDFLNRYMNMNLVVDGEYGKTTAQAVGKFQKQHREDILDPWNYVLPTNRWYKSTRATANGILGCEEEMVYLEDVAKDYTFDNQTLFGSFKSFVTSIFN